MLLAASGVLAMAETSLVRMNRIKAKSLVDEKKRGARQLARLVENPANFLNPILLLVLICQLVSATLVGMVAEHLFGGLGVLLGIVFEVVVIFVFFEAVPKNWAVQHADRAALLSAPIVSALIRFPPIRWLSSVLIGLANRIIGTSGEDEEGIHSYITDSELKAMADVAHEEHVIEHDERTFIHSIIDFGDTVTREVMTPRPDMVTVEADATVGDALEAALGAGYSRIPVEENGIDDIIGIAYAKDLVRAETAGQGRPDGPRQHAAGQVHPRVQGGVGPPARDAGGEVPHGHRRRRVRRDRWRWSRSRTSSRSSWATSSTSSTWRSRPSSAATTARCSSARSTRSTTPTSCWAPISRSGTWDTVGGLMLDLVGRVPDPGDSVEVDGFRLTAVDVRGRRIGRVRIEPTGAATDDADAEADGHRAGGASHNGN